MSRWWRAYDEALDDPKVQLLPPPLFKAWFNMLCLASKHHGEFQIDAVAFALRLPVPEATAIVRSLLDRHLLDQPRSGVFSPHNWSQRQYQSDSSAERTRRYRERVRSRPNKQRGDVTGDVTVTPPESETEQRQKEGGGAFARAPPPDPSKLFSEEANILADEVMTILGIDLTFVPPGWCGAAMWFQAGLTSGWKPEIVRIAVRKVVAARRGDLPHSFRYLGKPIAREHALAAAPIPTASVHPIVEQSHVQAPRSVQDVAREIAAKYRRHGEDEPEQRRLPLLRQIPGG